jgi:anti-sigma-K factor RskA
MNHSDDTNNPDSNDSDVNLPDFNEQHYHLIAAQYVLGTLTLSARLRFQALLQQHHDLRQLTYAWERRLNPLTHLLEPQQVRPEVWQQIVHKLDGFSGSQTSAAQPHLVSPQAANDQFWKPWAWLSTAVAAGLMLFVVLRPEVPVTGHPTSTIAAQHSRDVAVLSSDKSIPSWIVRQQDNTLILSAMNAVQIPADRDLELWAIQDNQAPISLGVIHVHQGKAEIVFSSDLVKSNVTLAISLEPKNGSPTGQPTGAVLYTGKVV